MNIILAHGILGFDKVLGIEYFNGIKAHLESKYKDQYTLKVLVTKVDPTDSIEVRGKQLRDQILTAMDQTSQSPSLNPADETHIIAHSMGGLDSRYILSPNNKPPVGERHIAEFITSLTTIGTPHKGSPVADLVYKILDGKTYLNILSVLEETVIASLAFLGISNEGLRDLTTEAMKNFNAIHDDNISAVRYFWAAGIGRPGLIKTSKLFLPLHEYIRFKNLISLNPDDRESDGVVPLSSAKREEEGWMPIGDPMWYADHADEVGHDLDNYISPPDVLTVLAESLKSGTGTVPKPSVEILAKYDGIVEHIAKLKKKQGNVA